MRQSIGCRLCRIRWKEIQNNKNVEGTNEKKIHKTKY